MLWRLSQKWLVGAIISPVVIVIVIIAVQKPPDPFNESLPLPPIVESELLLESELLIRLTADELMDAYSRVDLENEDKGQIVFVDFAVEVTGVVGWVGEFASPDIPEEFLVGTGLGLNTNREGHFIDCGLGLDEIKGVAKGQNIVLYGTPIAHSNRLPPDYAVYLSECVIIAS